MTEKRPIETTLRNVNKTRIINGSCRPCPTIAGMTAAPSTPPAQASDIDLQALPAQPPLADPSALARALAQRLPDFGDVGWVAQIGSTNAELLARVRAGSAVPLPWLLGTHLQTGGRGRAGRAWHNQPGACLMMSVALAVDMPAHSLPALSPLAGLAACEALRRLAGATAPDIQVKWPNDVQFGDKKLGGILVETIRAPQGSGHIVVIGMGVNLIHAANLSRDLARGVADWSEVMAAGHAPTADAAGDDATTLARIGSALARGWHDVVVQCRDTGFAGLRDRYRQVDALLGRPVNVLEHGDILFYGTAHDYDDDGRLLVATDDQGIKPVSVGDVSVRPRAAPPDRS